VTGVGAAGVRRAVLGTQVVSLAGSVYFRSRALRADTVHYLRVTCTGGTAAATFRTGRINGITPREVPFEPLAPADEWQQLIQAGKISVLLTAEQAQALLLTGVDANGGIKVTAKRQGVRIKLANGGAEAIAVSGLDITATLNSGTSTASTTKTLIDGSASAAALVSIAVTGSGAGVISDSTTFKQVPYAESDLQDKLISGL
jgi:hypothetical protein